MSPPLETNEKNSSSSTHSLGIDNDLSLLSSNNNNNNNNDDQAMDLFLNQVAEYNNQHLSFEQQQASSSSNTQLGIDPNQILSAHQQHDNKAKQEEQQGFAKPAEPTKKGKQKAKETGHSSLLHVSFELSSLHVSS